jgi:arylsulfatase A-like enzyme
MSLTGVLIAPVANAAPDVVVVVTDDQRWDDLFVMPTVMGMLSQSVQFTNAFVTTSECVPSRASLLSGRYAHNHGVRTLDGTAFVGPDVSTLATWLHARRYRTAMVGKYLNGYVRQGPPARPTWYIPPGWDVWRALRDENYYNYTIVDETGGETAHGNAPEDYSTDVLRDHALAFLRDAVAAHRRFLLYFAPYAPHVAWPELDPLPAPRHVGLLLDTPPLRPPSFMEADISDKPPENYLWWLGPQFFDPDRIKRLESLLAVDEAVAAFLDTLRAAGVDRRTIIVFTSDNGYLLGEHRLLGKLLPYEEAHRVPLVVWDPRHVRAARTDQHLVLIEDIAPTIADMAHAKWSAVDGQSLRPFLQRRSVPWRASFPLESWYQDGTLQYRGAHTERWAYDRRTTDAEEMYDLTADPYELQNLTGDSAEGALLDGLRALTSALHAGE